MNFGEGFLFKSHFKGQKETFIMTKIFPRFKYCSLA